MKQPGVGTFRRDAFYYHDAWVRGVLEIDFGASLPRFSFVAEDPRNLPRKGRMTADGRVEGFVRKAELPTLQESQMCKPPPGNYSVLISPSKAKGYTSDGDEIRTWLVFAVQEPAAIIGAVKDHRA